MTISLPRPMLSLMVPVRHSAAFAHVAVLSFLLSVTQCLAEERPATQRATTENDAFVIPKDEIPKLRASALKGSSEDAYRLAQYFLFVALDEDQGTYWLTIAAENGNASGEYGLGLQLKEHGDAEDQLRACFWLLRAKQHARAQTLVHIEYVLNGLPNRCEGQ